MKKFLVLTSVVITSFVFVVSNTQAQTTVARIADKVIQYTGGANVVWIGLNDLANEGNFVWTNGSTASYRNWNTGEPKGGNYENHVVMTSNGKWSSQFYLVSNHLAVTEVGSSPVSNILTVNKSGTGSGTATGGQISCGSTCSTTVTNGTSVTLAATPSAGSLFTGWSGGSCSGTGTCTVTVSAPTTVMATFNTNVTTSTQSTLTVTKSGTGSGIVANGDGTISCGSKCSKTVTNGTTVGLVAIPSAGSTFTGWSGVVGCGRTGPCAVTVNSATNITATFNTSTVSSPTTPTLTVSTVAPDPGQTVIVNWTASALHSPNDWVAVFTTTAANTAYYPATGWKYVPAGSSGTLSFTAPTTPGAYQIRHILYNSSTIATTSNTFTVATPISTTLSVSPTTPSAGAGIVCISLLITHLSKPYESGLYL